MRGCATSRRAAHAITAPLADVLISSKYLFSKLSPPALLIQPLAFWRNPTFPRGVIRADLHTFVCLS
ncbi:hypothetical protein ACI3PL_25765, partial [Lacticaseibacillus paracasei]